MRPSIVHLIGFPGAGKYTIAKELSALAAGDGATFRVVDNHHVNNTVFAVLDVDGMTTLPHRVWDFVSDVRRGVMGAIAELGPPEWSYVFTNVLFAGHADDEAGLVSVAQLADSRGCPFVPVRLYCEVDELARRIVADGRRERMKWRDADGVRTLVSTQAVIDTAAHDHRLDLDVTRCSAGESAEAILDHVRRIT